MNLEKMLNQKKISKKMIVGKPQKLADNLYKVLYKRSEQDSEQTIFLSVPEDCRSLKSRQDEIKTQALNRLDKAFLDSVNKCGFKLDDVYLDPNRDGGSYAYRLKEKGYVLVTNDGSRFMIPIVGVKGKK